MAAAAAVRTCAGGRATAPAAPGVGQVKPFAYERALSIQESMGSLAAGARVLAGGTDMVPLMRQRLVDPDRLVDLTAVGGAPREVSPHAGGGLRLGALLTLAALAGDDTLRRDYSALAQAVAGAASAQIRNVATLGGSLCQWNRCWYFRAGIPCLLHGGDACPAVPGDHRFHAIFRDGPCIAVHPSDPAVALLALGARVEVTGPDGARSLDLGAFLLPPGPGRPEQTVLEPSEVVTAVLLPAPAGPSVFRKAMDRAAWAFALVSVAVSVTVEGGRVVRAAIALGGVAGVPRAATAAAESLRGRALDVDAAARAADLAVEGADPLHGTAYKVDLTRRLVRTALLEIAGAPSGA